MIEGLEAGTGVLAVVAQGLAVAYGLVVTVFLRAGLVGDSTAAVEAAYGLADCDRAGTPLMEASSEVAVCLEGDGSGERRRSLSDRWPAGEAGDDGTWSERSLDITREAGTAGHSA